MEGSTASSSRVNASDLNGPVDSAPAADFTHPDRRERRASPSYDASAAAAARQQSNGSYGNNSNNNSNWRRLTPERPLARHDEHAQGRPDRQYESRPQQQQRNNYGGNRGGRGGGDDSFFASRQAERDASTFSIWPPSPKTPRNEDSEDERDRRKRKKDKKHKSSSHKSSHHRKKRYSSETESDSDDGHRKSKKHRSSKHRHSDDKSESEYEKERRRRREKKHRDGSRSRSRSKTVERIHNDQEDEWAEKGGSRSDKGVPGTSLVPSTAGADRTGLTSSKGKGKEIGGTGDASDSDSDDVGPKPLAESVDKHNSKDYGGALLRGEGAAMAAYVAEGARIPRRGEIGLESDQIVKYEDVGYVMSGSRHRRMNAVRMRKENQVITAEEKRQLLKTQKEEQDKKETMVVSSFKELLEQRLQGEKRKQRDDY